MKKFEQENNKAMGNTYAKRSRIFESMLEWKYWVLKDENPLNGLTEKINIIKMFHKVKRVTNQNCRI